MIQQGIFSFFCAVKRFTGTDSSTHDHGSFSRSFVLLSNATTGSATARGREGDISLEGRHKRLGKHLV